LEVRFLSRLDISQEERNGMVDTIEKVTTILTSKLLKLQKIISITMAFVERAKWFNMVKNQINSS
jgi:hypothetical protein